MKLFWVLLLASVAWGQTTIYSGTVTTARIANPCELIGVGGRIYRLADYYQSMGMELCEKSLPMLTRPWDFLPLVEPLGPVQLYIIYPPSCEVDPFFYGGYCYKIKVEPYVSEAKQ